jgi:hypothetical protein
MLISKSISEELIVFIIRAQFTDDDDYDDDVNNYLQGLFYLCMDLWRTCNHFFLVMCIFLMFMIPLTLGEITIVLEVPTTM